MDSGAVLGIDRSDRTWPLVVKAESWERGLVSFTGRDEGGVAG